MSLYLELHEKCPPPTEEMFGKMKRDQTRYDEAARLTKLMETHRPFCFLRMGDVELKYLLVYQGNMLDKLDLREFTDGPISGTIGIGNPGLGPRHAERLWKVYELADYVDFHERNWPNEYLVPELKLVQRDAATRNPDKNTSCIFLTWVEKEFKNYSQGRRIGFAGAEARILEILSKTDEFKSASRPYWPDQAQVFYHQARNDGRDLDTNLDLVKADLRTFVIDNQIDTLFISLGGGAKIIGFELSRELGICCFDFGAMTRAITYSGCDGNRFARSPHSPFLYRISFDTYMNALEKAFPNVTPAQLLAKAHGQLLLEVMKKDTGWTYASFEYDFSHKNLIAFKKSIRAYRRRYKNLFEYNNETKKERTGFLHFSGTHRLTYEGIFFIAIFNIKRFIDKLIKPIRKP
jgi:hypothetical protein